jgi:hypothetical protein
MKRYYTHAPHTCTACTCGVQVFEPPPWYQVTFNFQRRQIERHDETMCAIRAQLDAAARGGCTPEVTLLAIAQILNEVKS